MDGTVSLPSFAMLNQAYDNKQLLKSGKKAYVMNRKIISIISEKGGVGKTTTTFNLACALQKKGYKVLAVDLDKQCNLSITCGYLSDGKDDITDMISDCVKGRNIAASDTIRHSENGLDYIPSNLMLDAINSQIASDFDSNYVLRRIFNNDAFSDYDYIIFDNKTAIDILTQNALNTSDYYILPIESGLYAFDGIEKILQKAASINATTNPRLKLLGILYNRAENRTNIGREVVSTAKQLYKNKLFATTIPYRKTQIESAISQQNGCVNLKGNTLAEAYEALAGEVIARIAQ